MMTMIAPLPPDNVHRPFAVDDHIQHVALHLLVFMDAFLMLLAIGTLRLFPFLAGLVGPAYQPAIRKLQKKQEMNT